MSSKTLSDNAGRTKSVAQSPMPSGKPLGYFANLSINIDTTTTLSQKQLRQLIATLLSISSGQKWRFIPDAPISQPEWVEEYWQTLRLDPIGVIKWAVQFLTDESDGGAT